MTFRYIDLFAGIGGFHAALEGFGGQCVFVSEIDADARRVYERNWGASVTRRAGRPVIEGDIIPLTDPSVDHVPEHDLLVAGFPCQPFSKSGQQLGINETRGTLFFNIAKILDAHRPKVVMLENVRNLAGPRHRETWATIIRTLRNLGYAVSDQPSVFSPHFLPPEMGGTPQVRERVFILGTYVGKKEAWRASSIAPTVKRGPVAGWSPRDWDLDRDLLLDELDVPARGSHVLTPDEVAWIDIWNDFVISMLDVRDGVPLPGFPLWADHFEESPSVPRGTPAWKANFLRRNAEFYVAHRDAIDQWMLRHNFLDGVPASRRKLEWQARDAATLWDCAMQMRPSGIRAKKPDYLPALVALTQTSIIGPRRRRLTVGEAMRLQGLPDSYSFGQQPDSLSFKQLGNGVAVGAVQHVLRMHLEQDAVAAEALGYTSVVAGTAESALSA